jgi:serine phosphatase RsbU (regulator of sigma subunit)
MYRHDIRVASAFSEASTVAGDFYNWSIRPDGAACVYLVDVEGHGFGAASQAILSATILSRTILGSKNQSPRAAMDMADRTMRAELGKSIAVTMSLIQISPDRKRLELANAGMPPALLFRFGQSAPEILQAAGVYVGAQ